MSIFIDIHTHKEKSSKDIVYVSDPRTQYIPTDCLFCLGLHPWYIDQLSINTILEKLLKIKDNKSFFALGEIGLDRSIATSIDIQMKIFLQQINFAKENSINTIVVHIVKSYDLFLNVLKNTNYTGIFLIHGFNANADILKKLLTYRCVFSIGHNIITNTKNKELINLIPKEKLFFETDDQYEYTIEDIYHKGSKLLDLDLESMKTAIESNFTKTFNKTFFNI